MKKFIDIIKQDADRNRVIRDEAVKRKQEVDERANFEFSGRFDEGMRFLEEKFQRKVQSVKSSLEELEAVYGPIRWEHLYVKGISVSRNTLRNTYQLGANVDITGYTMDNKKVVYNYYQGRSIQSGQRRFSYDGGSLTPMSTLMRHENIVNKYVSEIRAKAQAFLSEIEIARSGAPKEIDLYDFVRSLEKYFDVSLSKLSRACREVLGVGIDTKRQLKGIKATIRLNTNIAPDATQAIDIVEINGIALREKYSYYLH